MLSWILVYVVFSYQGVSTGQALFYNQASCESAKAALIHQTENGRTRYEAICVRNGG